MTADRPTLNPELQKEAWLMANRHEFDDRERYYCKITPKGSELSLVGFIQTSHLDSKNHPYEDFVDWLIIPLQKTYYDADYKKRIDNRMRLLSYSVTNMGIENSSKLVNPRNVIQTYEQLGTTFNMDEGVELKTSVVALLNGDLELAISYREGTLQTPWEFAEKLGTDLGWTVEPISNAEITRLSVTPNSLQPL